MGRGKHCTAIERKLIRNLRNQGKTYKEISVTMGCSQNKVTNALKPEKSRENRGRPRKTCQRTDDHIAIISKKDPFKPATKILNEINENISVWTVRRRLLESTLPARTPRKVPLLGRKNIMKRKIFAKNHIAWRGPDITKKWRNILWSDETKINLFNSDGKQYVRRPSKQELSPRFTAKTVKHGGGNIMVWGCFSWYGVGPLFWIKDIMTQYTYVDILNNVMLTFAEENMPIIWHFQQDCDPKHTSKAAKEWFTTNNVKVLEWPPQSPDLNPLENLWRQLKLKISGQNPKNRNELWMMLQEAWYSIPVEVCRKLVDSMPSRCTEVLKNKGYATKY